FFQSAREQPARLQIQPKRQVKLLPVLAGAHEASSTNTPSSPKDPQYKAGVDSSRFLLRGDSVCFSPSEHTISECMECTTRRNHQRQQTFPVGTQPLSDQRLSYCIHRRRWLNEHKDRRTRRNSPGERNPLTLAPRKPPGTIIKLRFKAVGKLLLLECSYIQCFSGSARGDIFVSAELNVV